MNEPAIYTIMWFVLGNNILCDYDLYFNMQMMFDFDAVQQAIRART